MSLLINHFYRFAEFIIDTDQRVLLRQSKPQALAPKVFDTLLILVENGGRVVEKHELMSRVWPDTFVEEANLTYNIQQLRKALGDNARRPLYIETIPRRGYRFIASVEEVMVDTGAANDQITRRIETLDGQPQGGISEVDRLVERQLSGRREPAAAKGASGKAGKRSIALAAAVAVTLAGLTLILWRYSAGSNRGSGQDRRAGSQTSLAPLKLEKLTVSGHSGLVAISPDGKFIAYTQNVENKSSIWLRQLATNTNVEIVPPAGAVYGLAFANSGESLYFARRDPNALYRISVLGGVATKIVDAPEGKFALSSDDHRIAFIRKSTNRDGLGQFSLMTADSDGMGEQTLLVEDYPEKLDAPVWTPDDQSIICARGVSASGGQEVSLVAVKVEDGRKTELSPERFFSIKKIVWLPDKSGLLMSARKESGQNSRIWRVSYPGFEMRQATEDPVDYLDLGVAALADKVVASQATRISDLWVGPSHETGKTRKITQAIDKICWTPDGRILYASTASGNTDLWVMRPDGIEQRQLTVSPAVDGTPAVTPDNRYILFMSNRTGSFQVWRMDPDGGAQTQLTSGGGKNFPAVSPDGRWVFYNTTDDWRLWKVSIDGGEPTRLTDYEAAFASVSPEGKGIACVGSEEGRDKLFILPAEGGPPSQTFDFGGKGFSGFNLQWAPDGKAILYTAQRDGQFVILRQALSGGRPEELANFGPGSLESALFDFAYSPDGRLLAVMRGGWQYDIVLISDLGRR